MADRPADGNAPNVPTFEQLLATVESMPDLISWASALGTILYINPAGRRMLGLTPEEDVSRLGTADIHSPDVSARMMRDAVPVAIERGSWQGETTILTRDGRVIPVSQGITAHLGSDGTVDYFATIIRDISTFKNLERDYRRGEEFMKAAFASIQDGISILDRDMNILHTNHVMEQWYEAAMPLVGSKCFECYHGTDSPCAGCPTLKCLQSGKTERDIHRARPGSAIEWVELYSYPMHDTETGEVTGAIEFVRDITDRKRLEESLLHSQKMEGIGLLAGGVAHDFNNLLTSIIGHADMIKFDAAPGSDLHAAADTIERAATRAAELTRQLLGFARKGKMRELSLDLHAIIDNTVSILGRTVDKRIRISIEKKADPASTLGDPGQLEQVVMNLAVNARDAMPDGGDLTFTTGNAQFDDEYCQHHPELEPGPYVTLSVRDTGTGMDDDVRRRVFEPFFTTKGTTSGTGMGLAMVYGIVHNHGGAVTVQSAPGRGSTFVVCLPAVAGAGTRRTPPTSPVVKPGAGTVLVIDDEESVRTVLQSMLEKIGYSPVLTASGDEGIAYCRAHPSSVDAVLLDLTMPNMNGAACFAELRRIDPKLTILIVSGHALDGSAHELLDEGANGFIQKPFVTAQLSEALSRALDG